MEAASSKDDVFYIASDYVNISGFTVRDALYISGPAGIHLNGVNHCTISENTASGNSYGIKLSDSSNNNLTGNTAYDNGEYGIRLSGSSNNNNLTGNTAYRNLFFGIWLSYSSKNTFTSNTILGPGYGFEMYDSNNNNLIGNNVSNCGKGIYLCSSSDNNLIGNNVSNCWKGIYLDSSNNNNNLTGNTASYNDYGIWLESSNTNRIYNNYFNSRNNAYDNGNNVWNITKTTGTNIIGGPYLGGNYWSDYAGEDLDSDGLGDTLLPYNSGGDIIDGGGLSPDGSTSSYC